MEDGAFCTARGAEELKASERVLRVKRASRAGESQLLILRRSDRSGTAQERRGIRQAFSSNAKG